MGRAYAPYVGCKSARYGRRRTPTANRGTPHGEPSRPPRHHSWGARPGANRLHRSRSPQLEEGTFMKKILCVLVVLGVTAIAATPAQAAKYSINSTVQIADIGSTGSPPVSGSADFAGSIKGSA